MTAQIERATPIVADEDGAKRRRTTRRVRRELGPLMWPIVGWGSSLLIAQGSAARPVNVFKSDVVETLK
jgi:hypothetical protein